MKLRKSIEEGRWEKGVDKYMQVDCADAAQGEQRSSSKVVETGPVEIYGGEASTNFPRRLQRMDRAQALEVEALWWSVYMKILFVKNPSVQAPNLNPKPLNPKHQTL